MMELDGERPAVSVIMVNWDGREWLAKSLPALAQQSYTDFEVIVVDNGSQDGSITWLESEWPQVRIVSLDRNEGFAKANNTGIAQARGEWIATLNNDTQVEPDWLQNMVAAGTEPKVGMIACLIVYWDQPEIVDAAGIFVDQAGYAWNRGHGSPVVAFLTAGEVFGPPASAALYRRAMLDEIGLFDEAYFAYYEDVDLAWRAQKAGWRCRYVPDARVRHWHSATAKRIPWWKTYYLSRNKVWTITKNYAWPDLLLRLPLIIAFDSMSLVYRLISDRNLAGLRGRLASLRGIRSMWAKRTETAMVPLAPAIAPWKLRRREKLDGLRVESDMNS